jgi:hypothetical protein
MDNAIWIAVLGIVGGLGSAAYSNRLAAKGQRLAADLEHRDRDRERELAELQAERERERTQGEEVEALLRRYRDPLLRASFDLQSRLYNIVAQRFAETYYVDDRPDLKEYARENTIFVLAELLGWIEILRREVRFLDLGVESRNKAWVDHLTAVRRALQGSRLNPVLCVFNGEQRAIGEVMIATPAGTSRQETIGYAEFVMRRRDDPDFARWFARLGDDVALLAREPGKHVGRLVALQHALIELIDFLDPDCERLPRSERAKLPQRA